MTSQIVKVRSNESGNFNSQLNKMTFQIPSDGTVYNLRDSYLLLNMSVSEPTTNQISFGQDNLPMDAVCMFRRVKLTSSKKGVLEEIRNVHILRENLNYWQKGENQDKSRSLFGYSDEESSRNGMPEYEAFFSDSPKNTYVWLKDILGIGSLSNLNSDSVGELVLEVELENKFQLFQQRILGLFSLELDLQNIACEDVDANTAVLTTVEAGDVNNIFVGQLVNVVCILNNVQQVLERYVVNVNAGAHQFTLNAVLDAVNDATVVSVNVQSGKEAFCCNPTENAIGDLTLTTGSANQRFYSDLLVGMKCQIQYATIVLATGALVNAKQTTTGTITAFNPQTGVVSLKTLLGGNVNVVNAPAGGNQYTGISIIPYSTNLPNVNWQILKAECILYKLVGAPKSEGTQLFSSWGWESRQALANIPFEDTFRLESNAYNVYVMTPLANKIYSTSDGIKNYRFYVDDEAVFDRDVDVDSALHSDNMLTVLSNSQDSVKNLRKDKTNLVNSYYFPYMTPCKIYQRSVNGMPNFTGEQGLPRQLRIYLDNNDTQKLVYVFKERFVSL